MTLRSPIGKARTLQLGRFVFYLRHRSMTPTFLLLLHHFPKNLRISHVAGLPNYPFEDTEMPLAKNKSFKSVKICGFIPTKFRKISHVLSPLEAANRGRSGSSPFGGATSAFSLSLRRRRRRQMKRYKSRLRPRSDWHSIAERPRAVPRIEGVRRDLAPRDTFDKLIR